MVQIDLLEPGLPQTLSVYKKQYVESSIKWSTIKQGMPADWKKEYETITYQNLWDTEKAVLREKFKVVKNNIKK